MFHWGVLLMLTFALITRRVNLLMSQPFELSRATLVMDQPLLAILVIL
jgi:hypothetical protein